jgi:hypothetical protein
MSFRCDTCRLPQPAGTRPTTHVINTRPRVYNTPNGEIPGSEISKEVRVCPTCDTPAVALVLDPPAPPIIVINSRPLETLSEAS